MKRNHISGIHILFFILFSSVLYAGDGTENNPYSISEAQKVKDQSKSYWIKGYIVGEIENYTGNKYFFEVTPPFTGTCNWLIADSKDETTFSKCLPIQLKSGDVCDTLNLDWNPQFWRKEVMLYGKFKNYYATWGMNPVHEIRILSPYPLKDETEGYNPEEPEEPEEPDHPSDLPSYLYEDFNTILKEEPNFDIGEELDRFTAQKGWYGENVTTAKGKIRLGFESEKGWVQTPALNLTGNHGNYIVSFDVWDFGNAKEHKRINIYAHKGMEHIQTQEIVLTNEQKNYSFKGRYGGDDIVFTFSAQQNSKNRFYLDNINIQTDNNAVYNPEASYKEDFNDGIKELASDFLTTYEEGIYTGANGSWTLFGTKLDEDDSAKKNGRKSVVVRQEYNTEGAPGYICMEQDKLYGAGQISFYAANYGSEKGAKLYLAYSKDKGKNWITVEDNIPITSELEKYTYTVNQEGDIRIKIGKSDNTPMRACVDDIEITSFNPSSIETSTKFEIKIKKEGSIYYVYLPKESKTRLYNSSGVLLSDKILSEGWNQINLPYNGIFILNIGEKSVKMIR